MDENSLKKAPIFVCKFCQVQFNCKTNFVQHKKKVHLAELVQLKKQQLLDNLNKTEIPTKLKTKDAAGNQKFTTLHPLFCPQHSYF